MTVELPLGEGSISVSLPDCEVTLATPRGAPSIEPRVAARHALADSHGGALAERAGPDDRIAIVVTDLTRATPDDVLVECLLAELGEAGVAREQVTIVVGLGLHRPMTDAELRAGLGAHADLAVNHDPEAVVDVGTIDEGPTRKGETARQGECSIAVHPAVANADLVCSTGLVEPHQYAGFSGGAKTVVIGAGGEDLIRYTHGPEMLARENVRLGRVDGNPFRAAIDRAGDVANVEFCLNLTHGPEGFLDASAGDPRAVVEDLAGIAREALSVPIQREYDAVVAGVGAPKDANLYQASRAATYVALGDHNPLREGGRIVVPAKLDEGAGEGTGEQRFHERLRRAESAAALYESMRAGYEPGAQRAFVLARVLREYDVYITHSQSPGIVRECLIHASESVGDAIQPGSDVLCVPDALNTLLVEQASIGDAYRYQ